jgi:alpha-mannosidase
MKNKNNSRAKCHISCRTFISYTTAGTAVIVLRPVTNLCTNDMQQVGQWHSSATKFRFHMIGQAHIDPVWLWSWSEGISIVQSTFRSTLERMNETPDFCFTASSQQFYQRVDEGRWNIVGEWWVELDVNIPSGEAMVRQEISGHAK